MTRARALYSPSPSRPPWPLLPPLSWRVTRPRKSCATCLDRTPSCALAVATACGPALPHVNQCPDPRPPLRRQRLSWNSRTDSGCHRLRCTPTPRFPSADGQEGHSEGGVLDCLQPHCGFTIPGAPHSSVLSAPLYCTPTHPTPSPRIFLYYHTQTCSRACSDRRSVLCGICSGTSHHASHRRV